jgi:NADH-quinone oxidoreductase subunit J
METFVFCVAALMVLAGALGVVLRRHPVHCALSLVLTLFGVAVLFIAQDAQFLAAVQVIVYAGAIVVMFLFVIMLLGVDRAESLSIEPLKGQRPLAAVVGVGALGMMLIAVFWKGRVQTAPASGTSAGGEQNINALARSLFGTHVFAFEVTSVLLVIAVAGTVLLAKRPPRSLEKIKQLEELTK